MRGATPFRENASTQVTCIACGEKFDEDDTYEYDKYGDQWCRRGKEFERVCKPCYRENCRRTRDGLEEALIAADAGQTDRETFLQQFCELMAEGAEREQQER